VLTRSLSLLCKARESSLMSVNTVTMLLHASAGWLACSHLWHVVAEEADRHAARGGATDGDVEKNLRDAKMTLVNLRDAMTLLEACKWMLQRWGVGAADRGEVSCAHVPCW